MSHYAKNIHPALVLYDERIEASLTVDKADIIKDFITDLIHWCEDHDVDFDEALLTAFRNYDSEAKL